jgi:type II secretory pathway component PulF
MELLLFMFGVPGGLVLVLWLAAREEFYRSASLPLLVGPPFEMLLLYQEMASAVRQNFSLASVLESVSKRTSKKRRQRALERFRNAVARGDSLAEAAQDCRRLFPPRYQPYLVHGVRTGQVPLLLDLLIRRGLQEQRFVRRYRDLSLYLLTVLAIGLFFSVILTVWVVPIFAKMFSEMSGGFQGVPRLTEAVLSTSGYPLVAFAATTFLILVQGPPMVWRLAGRSWIARLPPFGRAMAFVHWGQVCSTFGRLLEAGVSVSQALETAAAVAGAASVKVPAERVAGKVRNGVALSRALAEEPGFPAGLAWAAQQGERTGSLAHAIISLGDRYERSGDDLVERSMQTLSLVSVLVLTLAFGAIVLALYLPIFQMASVIG